MCNPLVLVQSALLSSAQSCFVRLIWFCIPVAFPLIVFCQFCIAINHSTWLIVLCYWYYILHTQRINTKMLDPSKNNTPLDLRSRSTLVRVKHIVFQCKLCKSFCLYCFPFIGSNFKKYIYHDCEEISSWFGFWKKVSILSWCTSYHTESFRAANFLYVVDIYTIHNFVNFTLLVKVMEETGMIYGLSVIPFVNDQSAR
jgi:hypothetical protein